MARGLVFAMEAASALVEIPEGADNLESELIEVNEARAAIEEFNDDIDSIDEGSDTLDSIADTLEASEETGGADPTAARIAEIAVEGIYSRLKVRSPNPIPAMESFGSTATRIEAGKLATSRIKDGLKAFWNAVKAMLEKVTDFIETFIKNIFDAAAKIKMRVGKLRQAIEGIDQQPKTQSIQADVNQLTMGGEFNSDTLDKGILELSTSIGNIKGASQYIKDTIAANNLVDAIEDQEVFSVFKTNSANLTGTTAVDEKGGFPKAPKGVTVYRSKEFPGNRAILYFTADTELLGEDAINAVGNFQVKVGVFNPKATPKKNEDIKVPSVKQMTAILNSIEKVADKIENNK
jgi:hypothetical protein